MRLFRREVEGGLTIADWDDGFIGLNRIDATRKFRFQFERWPCCPGAFEFNIGLLGLMFVIYNDGGPCQLEAYLAVEDVPEIEEAPAAQPAVPAKGNDWQSVPYPVSR